MSQSEAQVYLLALIVVFAAGMTVLSGVQKSMSEMQRAELKSMSPDPVAMATQLGMFGLGYFASSLPMFATIPALIALGAFAVHRVPYRFFRKNWPRPARMRLLV